MSYFDRVKKYGDSEADVKAWQTRRGNAEAATAAPAVVAASPIPPASVPDKRVSATPAQAAAAPASGKAPHLLPAIEGGRAHFARPGSPRGFRGGGELRPTRAPRANGKLKKDETEEMVKEPLILKPKPKVMDVPPSPWKGVTVKSASNGLLDPVFKAGTKEGHQTRLRNQEQERAMQVGPVVYSHNSIVQRMRAMRALHNRKK